MSEQPDTDEITLTRGKLGLGFNIRGGIDIPHLPEDYGIFVSKVHENGTAKRDGRLQEGDKIVQVNGNPLTSVTHNQAVAFFRGSDEIKMTVIHGAENKILLNRAATVEEAAVSEVECQPTSTGQVAVGMVVAGVAVALIALFVGFRIYRSYSAKS